MDRLSRLGSQHRPTLVSTDLDGEKLAKTPIANAFYFPKWLAIHQGYLYWASALWDASLLGLNAKYALFRAIITEIGVQFGNSKEELLTEDLKAISGLAAYHFSPELARRHAKKGTTSKCRLCPGIILRSGADAFVCACPEGLLDGTPCHHNGTRYLMILGIQSGTMLFQNASGTFSLYSGSNMSRIAYNLKENIILWIEKDARDNVRLNQLDSMDNNGIGRAKSLMLNLPLDGRQAPEFLDYDWVGDNVYCQTSAGNIWVCSRRSAACKLVVANITHQASQALTPGQSIGFALDPPHGRMYWLASGTIITGDLDGSNRTDIEESNSGVVTTLAVDQGSGSLYWVRKSTVATKESSSFEIISASLDGQNPQVLIRLVEGVKQLQTAGDHVFWLSSSSGQLFSCKKLTANGLTRHDVRSGEERRFDYFHVIHPGIQPTKDVHPCAGHLCSHICLPTPTGYMRCLCPAGSELLPNGWSCGLPDKKRRVKSEHRFTWVDAVRKLEENCERDHFPCLSSSECINSKLVCDGVQNCKDLLDEDLRCNVPCQGNHGCSHTCIRSPVDPICICPYGQVLSNDTKNCTKPTPVDGSDNVRSTIIGSVLGSIVACLVVISAVALWKYRQAKGELRDLTAQEIREFLEGNVASANVAPAGVQRAMLLPYTIILNPESISVDSGHILGSGEFGVVCHGLCNGQPVAVKMIKGTLSVDEFKAVLAEVKMMEYLGDHKNIVKFVGAEVSQLAQRKITIITELSPHGDLLHYLWKMACEKRVYVNVDEEIEMTPAVPSLTMVPWCEQIAAGMEHLTAKQIVHGDLAARNVLVFPGDVVKVADFGMSRHIYGNTQYQMEKPRKLPWRWASPELLISGAFSEASDVWAFGVTVWEIYTYGEVPYKGIMQFHHEFFQSLQEGMRLPQPTRAPNEIYQIMSECWSAEQCARPTFKTLRRFFHEQASRAR